MSRSGPRDISRARNPRRGERSSRGMLVSSRRFGGRRERGEYRGRVPRPVCFFDTQLRSTGRGELVIARAAARVRDAPRRAHPPSTSEAVQRRVECAFADAQHIAGGLLDPSGDVVAVARSPGERLEDEDVERAAEDVDRSGQTVLPFGFVGYDPAPAIETQGRARRGGSGLVARPAETGGKRNASKG